MIRSIGVLVLAGGYVALSPSLRELLGQYGLRAEGFLADHSPYSWAALGCAALLAMALMARSAVASR